jgi:photosystem II stability/assembly factor-like uncharacterized protein
MAKVRTVPGTLRRHVATAFALAFAVVETAVVTAQQQVPLFSDDFEHGAASWDLDPGWQLASEGWNHVLRGSGHYWASPRPSALLGEITSFECRFNLSQGSLHVNYRWNRVGGSRYFVRVEEHVLLLMKSILLQPPPSTGDPMEHVMLAEVQIEITPGAWHQLLITGDVGHLEVSLDGTLQIAYTDTTNPLLSGAVAFESLPETTGVDIDDVVLKGPPPSSLSWVFTGGPPGGIGYDIRIHPTKPEVLWVTDAYAGTHQSVDGGRSWVPRNEGITARTGPAGDGVPIFSLTIDPHNPNTLWVGTLGMRGVFKSTNGGSSWTEMDNGIPTQPSMEFRGFTVDPHNANVVYCGGNYLADPPTLKQRGFIYKTTDGGTSWQLLREPGALVRWIIVDPTDSKVIYASTGIFDRFATKAEGILKSVDGGRTWTSINNGLTSLVVGALAMHPTNPQVLIAGTGKAGAFSDAPNEINGGVFKSTDSGQHWRQVDPIHASGSHEIRFSAVAFAPSNPDLVFADAGHLFLRSNNGGETWEVINIESKGDNRGQPIALTVHPTNPNTIYMNSYDGGVFMSTDGGSTWRDSSSGYTGLRAWDVAVDSNHPENVVVSGKNGVHVSTDGGHTWRGRYTAGWVNNTLSIVTDPTNGDNWLAGAQITGSISRTTDGGDSWEIVLPSLGVDTITGRRSIYRLDFAPSAPATVYAATGVDTMFVQTPLAFQGPGVFKSGDHGATWTPVNRGLEGTSQTVLSLAIHPQDARVVYIGLLDKGVYKTTDGGTSWLPANHGLTPVQIRSLAVDRFNPSTVYAGAERGGFWRSTDAGASWKQSSYGMPPEASIHAIAVDATHAGVVYAGDLTSGVYRSTDSGATWTAINNGLRNRAVNALSLTPDGLHLYAATEGSGVFRLDLPDQSKPRRHLRSP